jgi:hypothetical protein
MLFPLCFRLEKWGCHKGVAAFVSVFLAGMITALFLAVVAMHQQSGGQQQRLFFFRDAFYHQCGVTVAADPSVQLFSLVSPGLFPGVLLQGLRFFREIAYRRYHAEDLCGDPELSVRVAQGDLYHWHLELHRALGPGYRVAVVLRVSGRVAGRDPVYRHPHWVGLASDRRVGHQGFVLVCGGEHQPAGSGLFLVVVWEIVGVVGVGPGLAGDSYRSEGTTVVSDGAAVMRPGPRMRQAKDSWARSSRR